MASQVTQKDENRGRQLVPVMGQWVFISEELSKFNKFEYLRIHRQKYKLAQGPSENPVHKFIGATLG